MEYFRDTSVVSSTSLSDDCHSSTVAENENNNDDYSNSENNLNVYRELEPRNNETSKTGDNNVTETSTSVSETSGSETANSADDKSNSEDAIESSANLDDSDPENNLIVCDGKKSTDTRNNEVSSEVDKNPTDTATINCESNSDDVGSSSNTHNDSESKLNDTDGNNEALSKEKNNDMDTKDNFTHSATSLCAEIEPNFDDGVKISSDHLIQRNPEMEKRQSLIATSAIQRSPNSCPIDHQDFWYEASEDESDTVKESRSSSRESRNFTLPYFQLPKPDLESFVSETSKCLDLPVGTDTIRPFDNGNIYENIEECTLETNWGKNRCSSDYAKVISSIGQMDDSKSPGIKRLALKEFLKKKIEQKKFDAFNRSKEISKLEEEMESEEENSSPESEFSENDYRSSKLDEKIESKGDISCESDDGGERVKSINIDTHAHIPVQLPSKNESSEEDFYNDFFSSRKQDCLNEVSECFQSQTNDSGSESEEDFRVKKKKVQVLEDSSEDDLDPVSEPSMFGTDFISQSSSQVCEFSLPSYQPGGGFTFGGALDDNNSSSSRSVETNSIPDSDDSGSGDSLEAFKDQYYENQAGNVRGRFNPLYTINLLGECDDPTMPVLRGLDDSPEVLSNSGSDIFNTQDVEAVCSGAFKNIKESNKGQSTTSYIEKHLATDDFYCSSDKGKSNLTTYKEFPHKENVNEFFDNEAELSGEDDGQDDAQDADIYEDEGLEDLCVADNEVPSNEELREEIADLHMKRVFDDDDEFVKQIKEQFLDDGELNNEGSERTRRFAWKNNDVMNLDSKGESSDSESDVHLEDTWSSLNREKAKWCQENTIQEEELSDDFSPPLKKRLPVHVIGKPRIFEDCPGPSRFSFKRPRESLLDLDDGSSSKVLKKLKGSEEDSKGSRTTKHFVFKNDGFDDSSSIKNIPKKMAPDSCRDDDDLGDPSVFNKM